MRKAPTAIVQQLSEPVLRLGGQLEPPEMEKQIPDSDQKLKGWLAARYCGGTWADVLRSPFWQKMLLSLQDSSFFCEYVLF